MSEKSFVDWRGKGEHLPEFMRDFHDQKDLFKSMLNYFDNSSEMPVNWVDAHVFTIDWFLWFMAAHGYTLQKTRVKACDFHKLDETIKAAKQARSNQFADIIKGGLSKNLGEKNV